MGDFNEDILVSSSIHKLLEQHGYTQHVRIGTTEKGTLIDQVYMKDTEDVIVEVTQTYCSFQEAVLISLLCFPYKNVMTNDSVLTTIEMYVQLCY